MWRDVNEIKAANRKIIHEKYCEAIVVSMGEAGALLVTANDTTKITPLAVERKSIVGADDSMVEGIVVSLSKEWSILQAIQYSVAYGTAAKMNPGTELCHREEADKLFAAITKGGWKTAS